MSRILFFAAGAAAGAYALRKYQQTVEPLTPKGWVKQAEKAAREAGSFIRDAREAMVEREAQIHGNIGTVDTPNPAPAMPTLTGGPLHEQVDVRSTGQHDDLTDVRDQSSVDAESAPLGRRRRARAARRTSRG